MVSASHEARHEGSCRALWIREGWPGMDQRRSAVDEISGDDEAVIAGPSEVQGEHAGVRRWLRTAAIASRQR